MSLPKQWNSDVALASLNPSAAFAELYVPLWWYSGSYQTAGTTSSSAAYFMNKGTTGTSSNKQVLFTVNSNWSSNTLYAFEVCMWLNSGSGPVYAALYDATAGSVVSASQISTTATSATVLRSGTFALTPGHSYAITTWDMSGYGYITDASLIIFPPAPSTSPYDVASISLTNPSGNTLKEAYIPLWMYSSGTTGTTLTSSALTQKGSVQTVLPSSATSASKFHTLSTSWSSSQKFAFEASVYISSSSGSVTAALYDFTAGSYVSSSTVNTTSTTATLIRSSTFTLTPGRTYGVAIWTSNSSFTAYLTKAHLVALAQ